VMDQMFNSMSSLSDFDLAKIFKMNDYSAQTQRHLSQVYLSLMLCVLAAAVGAATSMYFRVVSNMNLLGFLGGMGMLMWINSDSRKDQVQRRMGMLCGFGFFQGLSLGPLLSLAAFIDPALIVTALLGTVAVFACFTAAAVVAKRRAYLYLGGILGSAVSLMFVLSLMNMFFRSVNFYMVELYGGLLIFSGYVVFDTQLILEKAEAGSVDVVGHAATLFVDFVAIFVRILIILLRNSDKKSNNKSRKDRNRSEF
jgi:FtsH-binding integral membrane protein